MDCKQVTCTWEHCSVDMLFSAMQCSKETVKRLENQTINLSNKRDVPLIVGLLGDILAGGAFIISAEFVTKGVHYKITRQYDLG